MLYIKTNKNRCKKSTVKRKTFKKFNERIRQNHIPAINSQLKNSNKNTLKQICRSPFSAAYTRVSSDSSRGVVFSCKLERVVIKWYATRRSRRPGLSTTLFSLIFFSFVFSFQTLRWVKFNEDAENRMAESCMHCVCCARLINQNVSNFFSISIQFVLEYFLL